MSDSNHTATPWKIEGQTIWSHDGESIAAFAHGRTLLEQRANTELIVTAVNFYKDQTEIGTGWVDIKDRLPEKGLRVLVFANGRVSNDYRTQLGYFSWHPKDGTVTHWMLLPQPPKI